jgi:hypothetical protein
VAKIKKRRGHHAKIIVKVSAEESLECINEVSKWWGTHVEGRSKMRNDISTVRFARCFFTFKITESVPGQKVEWLVTNCSLPWLQDKREWIGTKVSVEISSKGSATIIDFTHIGLVPEIECYEDCELGWNLHFKESLQSFITEGKGQPAY